MKNRILSVIRIAVCLGAFIFLAFGNVSKASAADPVTIKLHYHRPDGAYEGWDVWLWDQGGDGAGYAFANEDGEMVATKVLPDGVVSEGFIVRTASWAKDVGEDQFIDIAEVLCGTVHIYVESGVPGYTKKYGPDVKVGIKLKSAAYEGDSKVTVYMTAQLDRDPNGAFAVSETDGSTIKINAVKGNGDGSYTLSLAKDLEGMATYFISYDGAKVKVTMPNVYSTKSFEEKYTYTGNDLGAVWTKEKTTFRVWTPVATAMKVNLYKKGTQGVNDLIKSVPMTQSDNGTWVAEVNEDLNGVYYTYVGIVNGEEIETIDPYARTSGINGKRGMVIDLASTNPEGWDKDTNPHKGESITDAIIYETHIRDFTVAAGVDKTNVGKFLGVAQTGTKTESGISTGLDHIKELGVTHLHILPFYDFGSVNEGRTGYNWGYDPQNYNIPEGSYSTDPYSGEVRVKELKQMVKTLHDNNISVVMDVVYNHVYNASEFSVNVLVPGYFSRVSDTGAYSNGSGCGNDTASERSMVKKFIVDSVNYWADEYHIDGFRFDLVGLLDTETINEIVETVHKNHPDVIFYGEGWTMTTNVTKTGYKMATQVNSKLTPDFAYFNDTIRDGLKGSVFNASAIGFATGASGQESAMSRCLLGKDTWCKSPSQTINYASCHDNNTLFDRIAMSKRNASFEERVAMNNLAAAVYMLAEGTPFMQAGEEMLRSKVKADGSFDENSYNSGDKVNAIDYSSLDNEAYADVFEYYKGLIAFRKAHPALRLSDAEAVAQYVTNVPMTEPKLVAVQVAEGVPGEKAEGIFMVFNGNEEAMTVDLPDGKWDVYINKTNAGTKKLATVSGKATVEGSSALVLVKHQGKATIPAAVAAVVLLFAGAFAAIKNKKKDNK